MGLWYFFEETQPQLLYGLFPRFTRHGLATEAAQRIIQYAFQDFGFSYLMAALNATPVQSQKVAERLKMELSKERIADAKLILFYKIINDKFTSSEKES